MSDHDLTPDELTELVGFATSTLRSGVLLSKLLDERLALLHKLEHPHGDRLTPASTEPVGTAAVDGNGHVWQLGPAGWQAAPCDPEPITLDQMLSSHGPFEVIHRPNH